MCWPYGWLFGPKLSKQGSLFHQIFLDHWNIGGFSRNWQKYSKMGSSLPKFIIKVGMTASFEDIERADF